MNNQTVFLPGRKRTRFAIMITGVLMMLAGFAYWFFPTIGYATASMLFGWLLIVAGVVQLCVAMTSEPRSGRGWWLAGGILDMFVGFVLVRNIMLAEIVFPYFIACVFVFWGISAMVSAVGGKSGGSRWLHLLNGVLMLVIGFFFFETGFFSNMLYVSLLTSLAFIYWGFTLLIIFFDTKPPQQFVH